MGRNVLLVLSYDGTEFHGFQVQKAGLTVQRALEEALFEITGSRVRVNSSGRTDAGVHALCQVVNFLTESGIRVEALVRALNSRLPEAIRVLHAQEVHQGFHARKDAIRKLYRYVLFNGEVMPPFYRNYAWHLKQPKIDHEFLDRAAKAFVGEKDFTSFMGSGSSVRNRVRRVERFEVERRGEFVVFSVQANGFLKNMVRNMVGTLVDVAKGRIDPSDIDAIIESKNRRKAGMCAPPQGLYLCGVDYGVMSFHAPLPFPLDF